MNIPRRTRRIGNRDNWRCGLHAGGCGKRVSRGDATVDHIVPRAFWRTLDQKHPTSQGNCQLMCRECNNKKKSEMSGAPNFTCSCHYRYVTDSGDMEIWYREDSRWIKLCVLWKGALNNVDTTLLAKTMRTTKESRGRWFPIEGDGTGWTEGAEYSPPGPMRFQVKKISNMKELFRVGEHGKMENEFNDFMSDYEALGEVCIGQTRDHPDHPSDLNLQTSVSLVRSPRIWQPGPYYAYQMLIDAYCLVTLSYLRAKYSDGVGDVPNHLWTMKFGTLLTGAPHPGIVHDALEGHSRISLDPSIVQIVQDAVGKVLREGDKDLRLLVEFGLMSQVLHTCAHQLEWLVRETPTKISDSDIEAFNNTISFLRRLRDSAKAECERMCMKNLRGYIMVRDYDGSGGNARQHWKAIRPFSRR